MMSVFSYLIGQALIFIFFTVNTRWFSKIQVFAARDVNNNFSQLERRLLLQLHTCECPCNSDDDCNDCWLCCRCLPAAVEYLSYLYMFHLTMRK